MSRRIEDLPLRLAVKLVPANVAPPEFSYRASREVCERIVADVRASKAKLTIKFWTNDYQGIRHPDVRNVPSWAVYPVLEAETNEWGEVAP